MKNFYKNKRVLITGHTGFKGSWLSQILILWGAKVVGCSLPPETAPNLFGILSLNKRMTSNYIDIRDYEKVKKLLKKERPDIVFHLAAQPIVRESYDDPLKTYSTNTLGTANVLQAIKESGCVKSVIVITTDKVYENKEWIHPYREVDRLGGYDPYSASKAAADIITSSYIRSFFNIEEYGRKHKTLVAVARAGNVIGGGDWGNYRLVPDIVRYILEKNEKVIIRNPNAIRPWEHVLEPLSGYLMLGKRLYEGRTEISGAWNFGPREESFVSVHELVLAAIKILGKGKVRVQPDKAKHEANLLTLDTSKARSILGWKPKLSFIENVGLTFDWYKNFYDKLSDPLAFTNKQIEKFFES